MPSEARPGRAYFGQVQVLGLDDVGKRGSHADLYIRRVYRSLVVSVDGELAALDQVAQTLHAESLAKRLRRVADGRRVGSGPHGC